MENFKNLLEVVKYNKSIGNPFILCSTCSLKERKEIIDKLGYHDPMFLTYVANPNCTNLAIDLIDKEKGFDIKNMRIVSCQEEQDIRLRHLKNSKWLHNWYNMKDNNLLDL